MRGCLERKDDMEKTVIITEYDSIDILINRQDEIAVCEWLMVQRNQLAPSLGDPSVVGNPAILRMEITRQELDNLIQKLKIARSELEK